MPPVNPTYRIDLSYQEVPQPCPRHDNEDEGFHPNCKECEATQPRRVDIPEYDGLFVEIMNPRLLPWGERKRLFQQVENASQDEIIARSERIAARLITAWNIRDLLNDEELPLPKDDAAALDRGPDVVTPVMQLVSKVNRGSAVPKATTTV